MIEAADGLHKTQQQLPVDPLQVARSAQATFGNLAAYLPAYGKVFYLRSKKPGIHGNYDASGVTGAMVAPIPESPLRFLDCDCADAVALALRTVPRLADTWRRDRDDHAAFAILAPDLPNLSRQYIDADGDNHEFMSLRGPGLGLLMTGSAHPSGHRYTDDGQQLISLTAEEMAAVRSLFAVNGPPLSTTLKNPLARHVADRQDIDTYDRIK